MEYPHSFELPNCQQLIRHVATLELAKVNKTSQERQKKCPCSCVDSDCRQRKIGVIAGSGCEQPAVGTECDSRDPVAVTLEGLLVFSSGWIPQPDRAIAGSGREQPAVRREYDGRDPGAMAPKDL